MNMRVERKKYLVDNFIRIYSKVVPKEVCEYFINFFDEQMKRGNTFGGTSSSGILKKHIKDAEDLTIRINRKISVEEQKAYKTEEHMKMLDTYDDIVDSYILDYIDYYHSGFDNKFQVALDDDEVYSIWDQNIELYENQPLMHMYEPPNQGYHRWHCDWSTATERVGKRMLVAMLYLNDVDVGGTTEFLHQKMSIQPIEGTLVIWPAFFTHMHRGNPPISNRKYIVNKWFLPSI